MCILPMDIADIAMEKKNGTNINIINIRLKTKMNNTEMYRLTG